MLPKVNLETMIPTKFGEWQTDAVKLEQIISPERQELIGKLYAQTLDRSYMDSHGTRIMLSIAYGGNQSGEMQVHRPEVCYYAQGFQVQKERLDTLSTKYGPLPIKRLFATQEGRNEPITYWITVGENAVVLKGLHHRLAELRYGLTGKVPDGMLVRVSTINSDEKTAYRDQDEFIKAMIDGMSKEDRERIAGKFED